MLIEHIDRKYESINQSHALIDKMGGRTRLRAARSSKKDKEISNYETWGVPSWPKLWALTKRFHQLGIKFSEITLPKPLKWMVGIFLPKGHNSKSLSENNPKENKSDISDAYGQQCTSNHIA